MALGFGDRGSGRKSLFDGVTRVGDSSDAEGKFGRGTVKFGGERTIPEDVSKFRSRLCFVRRMPKWHLLSGARRAFFIVPHYPSLL